MDLHKRDRIAATDPLSDMMLTNIFAKQLEPFVSRQILAGAVTLVATKDAVLSLETVGYADLAAKKPMLPDTLFWIASITKPMTSAALLMLVEEGQVNLDDPVEKYLPEFKDPMYKAEQDESHVLLKKTTRPILVRNLLTHTSGLPPRLPVERPTMDLLSLDLVVRSYAPHPLQFEPGSKFQYGNAGFNTIGRIIEIASGMSYESFMEQRLFQPLSMSDTTFRPNREQIQRLAKTYKANANKTALEETPLTHQLFHPLDDPRRHPVPGGGLFSTANDVLKFARMILGNGICDGKSYLSAASIKQMTTLQTDQLTGGSYGLGWKILDEDTFGHSGASKVMLTLHPKAGLIMLFLTQLTGGWLHEDAKEITPAFTRRAIESFGKCP